MIKTYQAIRYLNFATSVNVGSQNVTIQFTGGVLRPYRRNGRFTTADVNLQKAIEKDSGFNREFKSLTASGENVADPENEPIIVSGITTVTAAKQYLLDKFPGKIKIGELKNKNIVIDVAARFNVKFSDLPVE